MLENKYPLFKKNEILEKEMLDLLRDNPMEIYNLLYMDFSDGIVNGFNFTIDSERKLLIMEPGILKHNGKIFWEKEITEIPFPEQEDHYVVKYKLNCCSEEKKYYKRSGEIITEAGKSIHKDELELLRFILREGAELRENYEQFEDLVREYNTIQIVDRKYSSRHKSGTLDPRVTKFWGLEALERENLNPEDFIFAAACINNPVEREIISSYINRKKRVETREYTNRELYEELNDILIKMGPRRSIGVKKIYRPEKIVVD